MTREPPSTDSNQERPNKVAKTDDYDKSNAKSQSKSTASASAAASGTATATATSTATGSDPCDGSAPSTATADAEANAEANVECNDSSSSHDANSDQESQSLNIDRADAQQKPNGRPTSTDDLSSTERIAKAAADAVISNSDCQSTTKDAQVHAATGAAAGAAATMAAADFQSREDDDAKRAKIESHDVNSNGNGHRETPSVETDLRQVTLGAYVERKGLPFVIDPDTLTDTHAHALSSEKLDAFRNAVSSRNAVCVLLAAGQGSRFEADVPKVIHPFMEKALAQHALDAAHAVALPVIVIVGHARHTVVQTLDVASDASIAFVPQDERLGTGHAVYLAKAALPDDFNGTIIVSYADNPGVDCDFLKDLLDAHARFGTQYGDAYAAMAVTGSRKHAGKGAVNYGRIVRTGGPSGKGDGEVIDIVEKKAIDKIIDDNTCVKYGDDEWTGQQLDDIDEFNSGIVVANAPDYFNILSDIVASLTKKDPVKYEYYATDFVKSLVANNRVVQGFSPTNDQMWKLEGANTVEELKHLEQKVKAM